MKILLIAISLLISVSAYAQVGGPCEYDEYKGTCTATGKDKDGKVLFLYDGEMRGEKVSLPNNPADEGFEAGAKKDCFLMFIKKGTCTPCLFSVGSCGEEAWDLFRNLKSAKAREGEGSPAKAVGGCSLCE